MSNQRETKSFAFQVKATGADGAIEGYGSVFGNEDSYGDVIAKGAFDDSIKAHKAAGTMPAMLWQHDSESPIGVWESMSEDANGLKLTGRIAVDTAKGKDAYALLKMGALNGLSIGFMSKEWSYDEASQIRTLTAIDLWEVSVVTFPANKQATVTQVKSSEINSLKDAERCLRDAGISRAEATAFVSRIKSLCQSDSESGQLDELMKLVQKRDQFSKETNHG